MIRGSATAPAGKIAGLPDARFDEDGDGNDSADTDPFLGDGDEGNDSEKSQENNAGFMGIPYAGWLILLVELCERMAYYGVSTVYVLYMKELLGFGDPAIFAATNGFIFWCYATVLLGGYVADAHLGRKRTIYYFAVFYIFGLFLLALSSSNVGFTAPFDSAAFAADPSKHISWATGGLFVSLFFIGLGTGGIKANVSPMVAEQLVDADDTLIERVFRYFYWAINLGAVFGMLVTPYLKRVGGEINAPGSLLQVNVEEPTKGECLASADSEYTGYYVAFAVMGAVFLIGCAVYLVGYKIYVSAPPSGSLLSHCFHLMGKALRAKWRNPKGKAPPLGEKHKHWLDWAASDDMSEYDADTLRDLKMTLRALTVFLPFPIYFLLYSQMSNNFIVQATIMELPHGITADQLGLIDPLALIILIPIFDSFIFPFLRNRLHLELGPIVRMVIGFVCVSLAMFYAGGIQLMVDDSGEWCPEKYNVTKFVPNSPDSKVSVFYQFPAYVLIAVSEIFASVASLEFAYSQAPTSMKSIVMACSLFMSAIAALLGLALAPIMKPEHYANIFFTLGGGMLAFTLLFYIMFRGRKVIKSSKPGDDALSPEEKRRKYLARNMSSAAKFCHVQLCASRRSYRKSSTV